MTVEAERLIINAVERRIDDGCPLAIAVEGAAEHLGLSSQRVLRAWVSATCSEQEDTLAFLARDHGDFHLSSPLPTHPFVRRHRFGVCPGDILATFEDGHTWLIPWDGEHIFVVRNLEQSDVS